MAWDGPILTDSGGFQVFSLRDTLVGVDDDGVTFRNVYDGAASRLTPELAAEIQRNLGSDIAMCLDQVPPPGVSRLELEEAVRRTTEWARRQRHAERAEGQLRFAISQGGTDPELRRRSAEELVELDFDGNAIGGLAIGEDRGQMFETTDRVAALLPADRPRYFMGIGDPEGILEVIEAGVDMFDCVLPTRTARTGSALTWNGRLNLRNARVRARRGAARRRLRLSGLHRLLARLHPPPRQPGRAARAAPALAAQSTLRPGADPRRTGGDRRRQLRLVQAAGTGEARHMPFVIVIVVLLALGWVFLVLPARRRQRSHLAMQDDVTVGDEIITAGGVHAVVREVSEDELRIEIAPGVVVTLDRRAVAAVAEEEPARENDQAAS